MFLLPFFAKRHRGLNGDSLLLLLLLLSLSTLAQEERRGGLNVGSLFLLLLSSFLFHFAWRRRSVNCHCCSCSLCPPTFGRRVPLRLCLRVEPASVELHPHADGPRVPGAGQEAHPGGHHRREQVVRPLQVGVRVAGQVLSGGGWWGIMYKQSNTFFFGKPRWVEDKIWNSECFDLWHPFL